MKTLYTLLIGLLLVAKLHADGITFFEGSWAEALAAAQAEDKLIFVDAYTAWCGPCKRMAREVFPKKEVGDYYNQHFINVKLDMEKGEGPAFAQKYGVRAYPTMLYINGGGEVVYRIVGGRQAESLLQEGALALKKFDKSADLMAAYEAGERDPQLVLDLVRSLNKAGKPSLKIANDYLATQSDLGTPFNQRFLFEAMSEADSRLFDLCIAQRAGIEAQVGADAFKARLREACLSTVRKAAEYSNQDLLAEAKSKMKAHYGDKAAAKRFAYEADQLYAALRGNGGDYIKHTDKLLKKTAKSDAAAYTANAEQALKYFPESATVLAAAERWAAKAFQLAPSYDTAKHYAQLLARAGKAAEAADMAEKAVELAQGTHHDAQEMQQLLRQLRGE